MIIPRSTNVHSAYHKHSTLEHSRSSSRQNTHFKHDIVRISFNLDLGLTIGFFFIIFIFFFFFFFFKDYEVVRTWEDFLEEPCDTSE